MQMNPIVNTKSNIIVFVVHSITAGDDILLSIYDMEMIKVVLRQIQ